MQHSSNHDLRSPLTGNSFVCFFATLFESRSHSLELCSRAAGDPHPDLAKGMLQEHCEMHGHAERFTTNNYGLTTTPEDEYRIATGQMQCPEEARKDREGKIVREVKTVAALKALPSVLRAKLVEMEIIAVVRAGCRSNTFILIECSCSDTQ